MGPHPDRGDNVTVEQRAHISHFVSYVQRVFFLDGYSWNVTDSPSPWPHTKHPGTGPTLKRHISYYKMLVIRWPTIRRPARTQSPIPAYPVPPPPNDMLPCGLRATGLQRDMCVDMHTDIVLAVVCHISNQAPIAVYNLANRHARRRWPMGLYQT